MHPSDTRMQIANRLYEGVLGALTPYNAWGFYLHNPEFTGEVELKNKLFVIWVCTLLDTVEASQRHLPTAIEDAKKHNLHVLADNGTQILNFCKLAADFLSQFPKYLQISMTDMRRQWVHGYYSSRHEEKVQIKFVDAGKLCVERISSSEADAMLTKFANLEGEFDEKLTAIREGAFSVPHPYWSAIQFFSDNHLEIYHMLMADEPFRMRIASELPYS